MAGSGIVALPTAIVQCQLWLGLVLLFVMATIGIVSAVLLGKCWVILVRRFPAYRTHCRKPYAEIGMRALGPKAKYLVMFCVNFTLFGVTTVFLLLSAKNIRDFLLAFFNYDLDFCLIILIVALILLPITLPKSPKDFWPVIFIGMLCTGVAFWLIIVGSALDYSECSAAREMPQLKMSNLLLALGTIRFTYGGHSGFPTIQHDMKDPSNFTKASVLAISLITAFNYLVVTISSLSYGNSLRDSVINSMQTLWLQQTVNLMITLHCLLTVTLVINPLNQSVEELFQIPQNFGYKRVALRTAIMGLVVFTAESIPSFGAVLNLIGGSTVTMTSAVFPCLFYLYLSAGEKKSKEALYLGSEEPVTFKEMVARTNKYVLLAVGALIALSLLIGVIATAVAIDSLSSTHFHPPCYLKGFFSFESEVPAANKTFSYVNCCGAGQNISRHPEYGLDICTAPQLDFY
uniref:Amino acid transporter transmembrane domain-containing protein n=1 Tax=Ditylenchus dipsaci TaxID=166011 RepID=A0A915CZ94_9BILA